MQQQEGARLISQSPMMPVSEHGGIAIAGSLMMESEEVLAGLSGHFCRFWSVMKNDAPQIAASLQF